MWRYFKWGFRIVLILAVGGCTRRDHSEAEDQRQKNFADHGKSLPQQE